jgi:L-gulonolactone oxidase
MSQVLTKSLPDLPLHALYRLLAPITLPPSSPRAKFTNWGQTFTCTPLAVFEPETEYQCELILELARREGKVVRAVGVGHSPSDLACTSEYMLRTDKLGRVLEVSFRIRLILFVSIYNLRTWILSKATASPSRNLLQNLFH